MEQEVINRLLDNIDQILSILGSIVVLCSVIVAGTNTPNPNTKIGKIYKIIEFLALVFGKTKDKGNDRKI